MLTGRSLYGSRWQTNLANDLGYSDGRRVRQWLHGDRPFDKTIWNKINAIMSNRLNNINQVLDCVKFEQKKD